MAEETNCSDEVMADAQNSYLRGNPARIGRSTVAETCGAMIDQVNQRLQLLMFMVEGNVQAETTIREIANLMREHWRMHRQ